MRRGLDTSFHRTTLCHSSLNQTAHTHPQVHNHPDLPKSNSVHRAISTGARWTSHQPLLRTRMQSVRRPIPHEVRIRPRRSATDRPLGIRRHQRIHPGLTIDASTTDHKVPKRRPYTEDSQGPDDKIIQPVLDSPQPLWHYSHL